MLFWESGTGWREGMQQAVGWAVGDAEEKGKGWWQHQSSGSHM